MSGDTPHFRMRAALLLVALVVAGFSLRLFDLDRRGMGHPEIWVPALDVPHWVQHPPPRDSLGATARATMRDGHPPGYFLLVYPWVEVAGNDPWTVRLPSVIFGTLSIVLIYLLGLRTVGTPAALVASALLALNGFSIFWSQMARMYALAACLGLGSTLLMLRVHRRGGLGNGVAYLCVSLFGLATHMYVWPLVFAQATWSVLRSRQEGRASAALPWQALCAIVASPLIALAYHQNPTTPWHEPWADYLGFGNLFTKAVIRFGAEPDLLPIALPMLLLGGGLLLLGSIAPHKFEPGHANNTRQWTRELCLAAAGTGAVILWFAMNAPPRPRANPTVLGLIALIPLLVVAACHLSMSWVARGRGGTRALPLAPVLAILPPLLIIVVTQIRPCYVARGTNVFAPYLLLAVAAGLVALWRIRPLAIAAAALIAVGYVEGFRWHSDAEATGSDSKALATALHAVRDPDEPVYVAMHWICEPFVLHVSDAGPYDLYAGLPDERPGPFWIVTVPSQVYRVRRALGNREIAARIEATELVAIRVSRAQ